MDTAITCPKCNEKIALSEALTHQIQDQITNSLKAEHAQQLDQLRLQAQEETTKAKQEAEAQLAKKFQAQFELQLKMAQDDAQESKQRNKELSEQLAELMKQIRQMKTEQEEATLVMEKRLVEEQDKIRQDATKKAEEEQHLKILEMRKKLDDVEKANEDLMRKLQQGSQQTQGEVLELELEEQLRQKYPNDQIKPVSKGVRGGDVVQEIWDRNGTYCGKILWELKNTKAWSPAWVDKLKADQREIKAETAIIVSEVLPAAISVSGFHNGIWVTERQFALYLAEALRANIIQLYHAKNANEGKKEKMEILYSYLAGTEFRHRVEAIVEAFTAMQEEIEKEKRWFMQKWARDEKHIRMVIDNTYGMHGDLKAIIGGVLPEIKGIESAQVVIKQTTLLDGPS